MIPKTILIATIFTVLFLLIKILSVISDNKKVYQIVLCTLSAFISGLFWGLSLFGVLWYEQVLSIILGLLCAVMITPRINTEEKKDIVLIGEVGTVTEIVDDGFFPCEYKGKLDRGESIIFSSKEDLKPGDKFEIKEVSDRIWVWKKE